MDPALAPRRPAWALLQATPDPAHRPRPRPLRRPRSPALDHPMRRRILHAIEEEPGCIAATLARRLGAEANVVRFHLRVLESAGYVRAPLQGRRRRYLALHHPRVDVRVIAARTTPAGRRVLAHLQEHRSVRFRELCAATGLPASTASAAVRRLVAAGVVEKCGVHRRLVVRLRDPMPPPCPGKVANPESLS